MSLPVPPTIVEAPVVARKIDTSAFTTVRWNDPLPKYVEARALLGGVGDLDFVTRNQATTVKHGEKDYSAWLDFYKLPTTLCMDMGTTEGKGLFQRVWNTIPTQREVVKFWGKTSFMPRYQQNYGVPYYFAGVERPGKARDSGDPHFKACWDWAESIAGVKLNQGLINGYDGGEHYIAPHADKGPFASQTLSNGKVSLAPVISITFMSDPSMARSFDIYDQQMGATPSGGGCTEKTMVIWVRLAHETAIGMCGAFQELFLHGIKVSRSFTAKRINYTFRALRQGLTGHV